AQEGVGSVVRMVSDEREPGAFSRPPCTRWAEMRIICGCGLAHSRRHCKIPLLAQESAMPKRKPYREVWHLWVTPDFQRVERGDSNRPWVDQRQVDFSALRQLCQDTFAIGPCYFRVPSDTIDQVTLHMREAADLDGGESVRCGDFARSFLQASRKQKSDVVDVA